MGFSLEFILAWVGGIFGCAVFCVCVLLFYVVGGFLVGCGFLVCFFVDGVPRLSAPRCQAGCAHSMPPVPASLIQSQQGRKGLVTG